MSRTRGGDIVRRVFSVSLVLALASLLVGCTVAAVETPATAPLSTTAIAPTTTGATQAISEGAPLGAAEPVAIETAVPVWNQHDITTVPDACAATACAIICQAYGSGLGLPETISAFQHTNPPILESKGFMHQEYIRAGNPQGTAYYKGLGDFDPNNVDQSLARMRELLLQGYLIDAWDAEDGGYENPNTSYADTHHWAIVGFRADGRFILIDPDGGVRYESATGAPLGKTPWVLCGYKYFGGTPAAPTWNPDGTSPPVTPGLPSPPANVTATALSAFAIRLTWVDSANTNAYIAQRLYSTLFMDCSTRLGSSATSYDVTGLSPGTAYSFRVGASNEAGAAWSDRVSAFTLVFPAKPENVKVATTTQSSATLTWEDRSNDETGFRVQYSKDGGKTWTLVDTILPVGAVTCEVTGLTANTPYLFQVGSSNGVDNDWSEYAPGKTPRRSGGGAVTATIPLYDLASVDGSISTPGEVDWYEWTVDIDWTGNPAPRVLTVVGTVSGGFHVDIYGPNSRNAPVTVETWGPDFNPVYDRPWSVMVRGEFQLGGTYYLRVRADSSSATGTYTIYMDHKP
jgi:hypothetical protein